MKDDNILRHHVQDETKRHEWRQNTYTTYIRCRQNDAKEDKNIPRHKLRDADTWT